MESDDAPHLAACNRALRLYNKAIDGHKRLPADTAQRLSRSELIIVPSGSDERWSTRLELTLCEGELHVTFVINDDLSPAMRTHAEAQRERFSASWTGKQPL